MVANFLVLPTGTSLLLSIPQHRFGFSGRALAVLEVAAIAVGRAKKDARVVLEVVVLELTVMVEEAKEVAHAVLKVGAASSSSIRLPGDGDLSNLPVCHDGSLPLAQPHPTTPSSPASASSSPAAWCPGCLRL
jgi:hypothetical protein